MKAIEKTWHVIFWTCGLSTGVVLLFTEMSGVTAPSVVAIVGFLTFIAFADYLIRRNKAGPVSIFATPLPIVIGNNCTSFDPQSSRFINATRLNLDNFHQGRSRILVER
ncbi:MAG TPA: hypothetical protein VJZ03_03470 [Candidatus Bathyarchaeia archaeon]|nr:hypothetical protein [Candidatus Bathyarchaeia archaeon]